MESKYQNGKIYKIVCNETGKIYIGSTISPLNTRLSIHKSHYKRYLQAKTNYTTSFEIIENNNYHIELICDYPCSCKKELETMEGKYIREMECINNHIPCRAKKEYMKQYYEQNTEKIREKKKQYNEQNRDKILQQKKEYMKQYYEQNRDKILQQKKEYMKQYREKMKQNKITI